MAQKDISISLEFGDESHETKILEMNATIMLGPNAAESLGLIQLENNDVVVEIKLEVSPGREKQTIDFLEKAMDEPNQEERMMQTPFQQLLVRPKSTGMVKFVERPGQVIIYYTLYEEYTFNDLSEQMLEVFKAINSQGYKPNMQLNLVIRGEESNKIQDKTIVEPNYIKLDMSIFGYNPKHLFDILQKVQFYEQHTMENPFYRMLTMGCKKIKLHLEFSALRNFVSLYRLAAQLPVNLKPDSYINKNLLKNKIECSITCKSIGAAKMTVNFQRENQLQKILQSFTKIYGSA